MMTAALSLLVSSWRSLRVGREASGLRLAPAPWAQRVGHTTAHATALVALACGPQPLPPEQPKQAPDQKASVVPVIVESTADAPPKEERPAPEPTTLVTKFANIGLATPESVLYDAATDSYLVSNVNGSPFGVDRNGFISRLNPDGSVAALKLVDGETKGITLNAPKGMTLIGRTLYVADITFVRGFDVATGTSVSNVEVKGAAFLNDLSATDSGELIASDTGVNEDFSPGGKDALYRIDTKGKVSPIVTDPALSGPNGVVWTKEGIYVATFGADKILLVNGDGKIASEQVIPGGALDGLLRLDDGTFLVSSWKASNVFAGAFGAGAKYQPVVHDVPAPADIGYDSKRKLVLVPLFKGDAVEAHKLAP